MTQPTFVPITEADQVRPALHLDVPGAWTTSRPAELKTPIAPKGRSIGTPGSDAGFALRLAARFAHDLKLREGENEHDVVLGCALIAARRAALFGRGPSIYDVQVALGLWGFLRQDIPAEVVRVRRQAFSSVSHDYVAQRSLVEAVPEASLRLTPAEVQARFQAAPAPGPAATRAGTPGATA
jgi:hypothetical protein